VDRWAYITRSFKAEWVDVTLFAKSAKKVPTSHPFNLALNLPCEPGESIVNRSIYYWLNGQLLAILYTMQKNTIQYFLTLYFDKYKQQHGMPLYQIKACEKLMQCRTEALGGHAVYCENDHLNGVWYNSCKHRSCPQCQALRSEHWLQKQEALLLDCQHHHWIFTLPHELHQIWHFNREFCFGLLFKSVGDTLKKLSADAKYLGAQPGFLLAFHSWARNLVFHPHIHCVIVSA
jgi:hypothetical protein